MSGISIVAERDSTASKNSPQSGALAWRHGETGCSGGTERVLAGGFAQPFVYVSGAPLVSPEPQPCSFLT